MIILAHNYTITDAKFYKNLKASMIMSFHFLNVFHLTTILTSTLKVTSPERNLFYISLSASFAWAWTHAYSKPWKHVWDANTEQALIPRDVTFRCYATKVLVRQKLCRSLFFRLQTVTKKRKQNQKQNKHKTKTNETKQETKQNKTKQK